MRVQCSILRPGLTQWYSHPLGAVSLTCRPINWSDGRGVAGGKFIVLKEICTEIVVRFDSQLMSAVQMGAEVVSPGPNLEASTSRRTVGADEVSSGKFIFVVNRSPVADEVVGGAEALFDLGASGIVALVDFQMPLSMFSNFEISLHREGKGQRPPNLSSPGLLN